MNFPAKKGTLIILLGLMLSPPALSADRIMLIGDSWGWRREASLTEVIVNDHGHSEVVFSVPPRILFSHELVSDFGLQVLTNLTENYPDTVLFHLSIGDNELSITPEQVGTAHEAQVHSAIIANVETAINHIWSIRPDMMIVWSGYDFFRPRSFPTPAESNEIHMRFGQACAAFAATKGPRLIYSDVYGALQLAFGFDGVQHSPYDPSFAIPPGDPSLPDPQWPSPYEAYSGFDATHPNEAGWYALAEAQYQSFYGPFLGDEPFQISAGLNGNWWEGPDRSGEGVQVEIANGGGGTLVFVATIYSYDTMGNQIFLIAVGPASGNSAEVEVFITEGGMWGDNFDPADINETQWGTGTFTASSCDSMHMSLIPNAEFQAEGFTDLEYDLIRLTTPVVSCPFGAPALSKRK